MILGLALRLAYVLAQAATDPTFALPALDGAFYVDWARRLAAGQGGADGAFYLAPLYPHLLGIFFFLFGEDFGLLYFLQQAAVVLTAGLLGLTARRLAGDAAGLAAALLLMLYHPMLFFAARPIGETLAIFLLVAGLWLTGRPGRPAALGAGGLAGVAALARPNLLLAPFLWAAGEARRGAWMRGALIVGGLLVASALPMWHNWQASGHLTPISANAGITFFHGNGPKADGLRTHVPGTSGVLRRQRDEATRAASLATGREMDAVEADRYWGLRALRARADDPVGTVQLLFRRLWLTMSNAELGLAFAPSMDASGWRWVAPVPFAVLLGLAAAAVALRGFRPTGGWNVWGTVAACAAVPLLFYVSSRYRLPLAALLCLPGGIGVALLLGRGVPRPSRPRWIGWAALAAASGLSFAFPAGGFLARTEVVALCQRAQAWGQLGDRVAQEAELRRALERDAASVPAHYGLGVLLVQTGRFEEAERAYRQVLARHPTNADAASNLARLLRPSGRAVEAVSILREALREYPLHEVCWTQLILAYTTLERTEQAWQAAEEALGLGVEIDPGLVELTRRSHETVGP